MLDLGAGTALWAGRTSCASEEGPSADLSSETPAMTGFARLPSGRAGVRMPSPQRDEQRTTYVRQRLLEAGGRGRIAERSGAGPATGRRVILADLVAPLRDALLRLGIGGVAGLP
jgi:hypothetical protein